MTVRFSWGEKSQIMSLMVAAKILFYSELTILILAQQFFETFRAAM